MIAERAGEWHPREPQRDPGHGPKPPLLGGFSIHCGTNNSCNIENNHLKAPITIENK